MQPKFLTKAERAALALQRRQEETAGLRAQHDEMRHLQRTQQQVGEMWAVSGNLARLLQQVVVQHKQTNALDVCVHAAACFPGHLCACC